MARNPWLAPLNPNVAARVTLFCFHSAGGSPAAFRQWPAALSKDVEVIAIRLPGHPGRFTEPLVTSMDSLIEPIHEAICAHPRRPFCLFGHSLGAVLAYELAMLMQQRGDAYLRHLIVAAKRSPQLPRIERALSTLPNEALIANMQSFGSPDDVFRNGNLVETLLPVWRADFALIENYTHRWQAPLQCDLTALGGCDDPWVAESDVRAWQSLTTGVFTSGMLSGGHFFLAEEEGRGALLGRLEAILTAS